MASYTGTAWIGNPGYGDCYLILNVWENWTSTDGNYSNCGANLILRIGGSTTSWSASSTSWSVWGTASGSGSTGYVNYGRGDTTLWSATFNVPHDANGDGSVSLGASFSSSYVLGGSTSAGGALTHINRYFSKTPNISLNSKTTTTINIKWSTSEGCNRVRYKIDNGGWNSVFSGNATSGNFTIANLKSNTTHSVVAECRRADSNLTSNSNTLTVTTSNKTGHIRVSGIGKAATPYIKIGGTWKIAVPHIRKNGQWERSK